MTTAIVPDPEAIRPELAQPGSQLPEPPEGLRASRNTGFTSLRVGVTALWLSVIVLLPLAAIAWQSAGGGWQAFWLAVTSHAAVQSLQVTLSISVVVTVLDVVFGLATAWCWCATTSLGRD